MTRPDTYLSCSEQISCLANCNRQVALEGVSECVEHAIGVFAIRGVELPKGYLALFETTKRHALARRCLTGENEAREALRRKREALSNQTEPYYQSATRELLLAISSLALVGLDAKTMGLAASANNWVLARILRHVEDAVGLLSDKGVGKHNWQQEHLVSLTDSVLSPQSKAADGMRDRGSLLAR